MLWATSLPTEADLRHGGTLRLASFVRALTELGHTVHIINLRAPEAAPHTCDSLRELLVTQHGALQLINISPPAIPLSRLRQSRVGLVPKARYRLLSRYLSPLVDALLAASRGLSSDAVIIGSRRFLPVVPWLRGTNIIIDWCDSEVLARARQARVAMEGKSYGRAIREIHRMVQAFLEERSYAREALVNLISSPVDKRCLDRIAGQADRNFVLGNGVASEPVAQTAKTPGRLVFSGNMDFPPNVQAALWFIDEVLPLVAARRPDVEFVVAGQNPLPELMARAADRVHVLGRVEDMRAVIAGGSLYVVPMISGSGFKNKVLEALASGTYVASTPMGVEFLGAEVRDLIMVGDSARSLAEAILRFLAAPEEYQTRLTVAREWVASRYSWRAQAQCLEGLIQLCRQRGEGART